MGRVDKALDGDEEAKTAFSKEFEGFIQEALKTGTITSAVNR